MLNKSGGFRQYFYVLTLIGAAVAVADQGALASSSKKKDPLEWISPTHIHMRPMMIPVAKSTVPITFFLEATKKKRVEKICKRMPKIRDALLRTLSSRQIPVKRRRLVLKGVDKRILKPVNKAVGYTYVSKVFIKPGAVKLGTGKIKKRPYAVIASCENILRSEKEREQAAKAAKEN